jgi:ribonuclease VapC
MARMLAWIWNYSCSMPGRIVPLDSRQAQTAVRAWRKFGKGRHPAQLNLGDCCVYALAKVSQEPVLCKGADFPRTDIPLVP